MSRTMTILLWSCILFLTAPLASWGVPITVPTDLNPGDQYRLVFVTSTTRDATSANIDDYNAFVTTVAAGQPELAALGTTWKAIASTPTIDARDNTGTTGAGVPIYTLADARIASNDSDLWDGTLLEPLNLTQSANVLSTLVWTGTQPNGTSYPDNELGAVSCAVGNSNSVSDWVSGDNDILLFEHNFYAISGVLTVVPEPGTIVLGTFGVTAILGWGHRAARRRRRQ